MKTKRGSKTKRRKPDESRVAAALRAAYGFYVKDRITRVAVRAVLG
jgi:hypothetical protein